MEGDEIEENEIFFVMEENETQRSTEKERHRRKQDLRYEKARETAQRNLKVTSISAQAQYHSLMYST